MNLTVEKRYERLLGIWLDKLMEYQVHDPKHKTLDGSILCSACSVIHGRCHDAVYPLMCMAARTGEEKYLSAAKRLFDWAECMVCDDGSVYNDSQNAWNGITVFSAIALMNALNHHSGLLSDAEKEKWENRLYGMTEWLYHGITVSSKTNINYIASNASAMAMAGKYFNKAKYSEKARELARFAVGHISENGLLYGEGRPWDDVTPRLCRPVDIGYNVEESLPSLYEYARITGDEDVGKKVLCAVRAHLDFMLPDGAWDNSFGSRNFKWTYWGSRTSDGCQALLNALGKTDSMYAEAALRNLEMYERCTENGLLHGGPDYARHGEEPCTHHAFCHAKVLAQALDEGVCEFERTVIPSDCPKELMYYPEIDTFRLSEGAYRMTATGYDFGYMRGGHASGGSITLLWHSLRGPVIASANTDYVMHEAHNQQLSRKKAAHQSLCPRAEIRENDTLYASFYDDFSVFRANADGGKCIVTASASLLNIDRSPMAEPVKCDFRYELTENGLTVEGALSGKNAAKAVFILPVISSADEPITKNSDGIIIEGEKSRLIITCETLSFQKERIFNLAPGFESLELTVHPDKNNRFRVHISVQVRAEEA